MMTAKLCTIDTGVLNHAAMLFTYKFKLGEPTEVHTRLDRPELFPDSFDRPCAAYKFADRPNFYLFVWAVESDGVDVFWGPKARKGK